MNHAKVVMWKVVTSRQLYSFKLDGEDVYGLAASNDGKKPGWKAGCIAKNLKRIKNCKFGQTMKTITCFLS